MRKLFYIFSFCYLFTNCNDGDIITIDIDFDDSFSYCEDTDVLVFYKTKTEPSESLSIQLDALIDDFIELDDNNVLVNPEEEFDLSTATNKFNYRTYNSVLPSSYFCEAVTPNISIVNDSESVVGTVTVYTVMEEDDNDGIPAEIEDENLDSDNDPSTEPTDTDGDGIPDYLDDDDDGDNVPTSAEKHNYSTSSGLENAQDTDEDGIPDYLDDDDDGDGVLTRDEENETHDQDPRNDITDNTIGADYLNDEIAIENPATAYREHSVKQTYTISVIITNFNLHPLTQTEYDFGTLNPKPFSTRTQTPDFN